MRKLAQELSAEEREEGRHAREARERQALAEDYYYGTRKVAANGRISYFGKRYTVGRQFVGQRVFVKEYVDRLVLEIQDVRREFRHMRAPVEVVVAEEDVLKNRQFSGKR